MQSSLARKYNQVGYDLSRFDNRRRVREALRKEEVRPARIPAPRTRDAVKNAARTESGAMIKPKARRRISVFSAFGYMAITALMILVVFSYMTLNELSIRSSALKSDLVALKEEEALLQVQAEKNSDLRLLEISATALGMTKISSEQVSYIDMSTPDYVRIAGGEERNSDFIAGLQTVFAFVSDYFS